ncbi:aspartate aminotransferase family protein [Calycomorphotria hydatis]|uniref:Acetylornithine aminotransferase n=1 Tax=Calycomorphotria hydatis TaxID=2528027 RepID=A0A517T843_9PLAN|nr:aspartate aminotransferase family protein [Calycomorphotria hydatis]QDT64537.1 Acetylornithine aminotransferase [Calycomorphotria hydatis]
MQTLDTTTASTIEKFNQYVIPNYGRFPLALVKGEGSYVWDSEGRKYLDLFPGWGCDILGYSPPKVVEAIQEQAAKLIHVPNTWYIEPQGEFAEFLCSRSFGKAFFCNSGAEAAEAAIKLARLHTPKGKYKILTFEKGFHGRTMAAVTATAQPKYHEGLEPLMPGFMYAPRDLDKVREMVDAETAAIIIEPVQGEGGVNIPTDDFLKGLREIADENECLLIFDEVQTGMGRLGTWFGYQRWGVEPDIFTLAKGLAGGVACGAIVCKDEIAPSLRPGMHASTFGGNPLAMAAGVATGKTIEEEGILENVRTQSARFKSNLLPLVDELSIVRELRVCGMMIGLELLVPAKDAMMKCMERGLIVNATQDVVLRLLPALNITAEQVDEGCAIIAEVLREIAASSASDE